MHKHYPILSKILLCTAVAAATAYIAGLLFIFPELLEVDSYYHIAVTMFIKQTGVLHTFPWAQMSIMKTFYSDKDLLLHIITLPFTFLTADIKTAAKLATLFVDMAFLGAIAYVLRKYVSDLAAAVILITLFFSPTFTVYTLYLRPATLANLFTVLGIYFLIQKNRYAVFIAALLYSLSHISAFTLVFFAVLTEAVRYLRQKEFYQQNISFCVLGIITGIIIHPNFPANVLTIYVNAFVGFFHAVADTGINFAQELYGSNTRKALLDNLVIFAVFAGMFWHLALTKTKISLATIVFTLAAHIYFVLSMISNRFWYPAVPMAVIAGASYIKDAAEAELSPLKALAKARLMLALWSVAALLIFPHTNSEMLKKVEIKHKFNNSYETAALWMRDNIPAGETIFHSLWGDSPFFICLNPKDRYLVVLDPIYMYYWSPRLGSLYQNLSMGAPLDAYYYLKNVFKTRYGFTLKAAGFYQLIDKDKRFRRLFETDFCLIFELAPETPAPVKKHG